MLSNTCPHCGKDMGAELACPHCEQQRETADEQPARKSSGWLIPLILIVCLIVTLALVFVPRFLESRESGQFPACKSNLKNIGTALEMYSTDHDGHYPKNLSELTPNYMVHLPTCQSAGSDTYSASYESSTVIDAYTLCCKGAHHTYRTAPNYPQYNSRQGLIIKP